ncbi:phosphatidic acid phosphatase (PAP2) family protein [Striga asiatica]|uniref:Phosphatidic acid phosphatase (PAP2) family protein n=1 Tax=Striga asiatica TaxID=4170 RepID=A0A5A7Q2A4_STRAF|nr:phosphatidic acid phosphatase (PAP2) family protein [Striga asiatica]
MAWEFGSYLGKALVPRVLPVESGILNMVKRRDKDKEWKSGMRSTGDCKSLSQLTTLVTSFKAFSVWLGWSIEAPFGNGYLFGLGIDAFRILGQQSLQPTFSGNWDLSNQRVDYIELERKLKFKRAGFGNSRTTALHFRLDPQLFSLVDPGPMARREPYRRKKRQLHRTWAQNAKGEKETEPLIDRHT